MIGWTDDHHKCPQQVSIFRRKQSLKQHQTRITKHSRAERRVLYQHRFYQGNGTRLQWNDDQYSSLDFLYYLLFIVLYACLHQTLFFLSLINCFLKTVVYCQPYRSRSNTKRQTILYHVLCLLKTSLITVIITLTTLWIKWNHPQYLICCSIQFNFPFTVWWRICRHSCVFGSYVATTTWFSPF